ncbi:hypothetical protein ACFLZZ_00810 [Nanoarchaeota archaeon]
MVFEVCQQLMSGNFTGDPVNLIAQCPFADALAGGAMGGLMVLGITAALFAVLAFYVYTSLAWQTIGKKFKYKHSWLAWIPIARWSMVLQLGKFHWAWVFLVLIPVLGWIALLVLLIIARWRLYEKRKYPGFFSLAIIIPNIGGILDLIVIGFVAWKDLKKKLF